MIDVLLGTGPANARPILIFLFFTLIASISPHRGLFTRGLALPEGRACPRCPHPGLVPLIPGMFPSSRTCSPHRGLDPGSPANINTEELRHGDYN